MFHINICYEQRYTDTTHEYGIRIQNKVQNSLSISIFQIDCRKT